MYTKLLKKHLTATKALPQCYEVKVIQLFGLGDLKVGDSRTREVAWITDSLLKLAPPPLPRPSPIVLPPQKKLYRLSWGDWATFFLHMLLYSKIFLLMIVEFTNPSMYFFFLKF